MSKDKLQWLKAAGIRAVKTVAQTAVATIGTATVLGSVDWKMVVSASVLSGVLSLLECSSCRRCDSLRRVCRYVLLHIRER